MKKNTILMILAGILAFCALFIPVGAAVEFNDSVEIDHCTLNVSDPVIYDLLFVSMENDPYYYMDDSGWAQNGIHDTTIFVTRAATDMQANPIVTVTNCHKSISIRNLYRSTEYMNRVTDEVVKVAHEEWKVTGTQLEEFRSQVEWINGLMQQRALDNESPLSRQEHDGFTIGENDYTVVYKIPYTSEIGNQTEKTQL